MSTSELPPEARYLNELYERIITLLVGRSLDDASWSENRDTGDSVALPAEPQLPTIEDESGITPDTVAELQKHRQALRSDATRLWVSNLPRVPREHPDPQHDILQVLLPWILDCLKIQGDSKPGPEQPPGKDDYRVAEFVTAREATRPSEDDKRYKKKVEMLAAFRAHIGAPRFDLLHGIRPPRTCVEQWDVDVFRGLISNAEYEERLQGDAERPVDDEMLTERYGALERKLQTYADMLQAVIALATDQRHALNLRQVERDIDGYAELMRGKVPLWTEQLRSIDEFLCDLRAGRKGEPVQCGSFSATSACQLVNRILNQAAEFWHQCRKIARRSHTDPSYTAQTTASALFFAQWVERPNMPKPNDLLTLLRLERSQALQALREMSQSEEPAHASRTANTVSPNAVSNKSVTVTTEQPEDSRDSGQMIPHGHGRSSRTRSKWTRETIEMPVFEYLSKRPLDTAVEVAEHFNCSNGLVKTSRAWKANRQRLQAARRSKKNPIEIPLEDFLTEGGANEQRQVHSQRRWQEAADMLMEISDQDKVIFAAIGEYERDHPRATPQETARACRCTAEDIERRQATLQRLIGDQSRKDASKRNRARQPQPPEPPSKPAVTDRS